MLGGLRFLLVRNSSDHILGFDAGLSCVAVMGVPVACLHVVSEQKTLHSLIHTSLMDPLCGWISVVLGVKPYVIKWWLFILVFCHHMLVTISWFHPQFTVYAFANRSPRRLTGNGARRALTFVWLLLYIYEYYNQLLAGHRTRQAKPNQLWGTTLTGLHEAYIQVIAPTYLCCCLRITTGLRPNHFLMFSYYIYSQWEERGQDGTSLTLAPTT